MENVKQRLKEVRRNAEYWEAERREKNIGGWGYPPVVYSFRPPFLFDCRLNCTRRMGIGDQICLVSVAQMVADRVGRDNVLVAYDAAYPGSADVWGMSGLPITTDPASAHPDATLIPCRGHIMESPIGDDRPCLYGEVTGNPVSQILYNLGWHGMFPSDSDAVRVRLTPDVNAAAKAAEIVARYNMGGYVTCTPLEVSRHNNDTRSKTWRHKLTQFTNANQVILFGCSTRERDQIEGMIRSMRLERASAIVAENLTTWKALVDSAAVNFTGNSAGMWLAIGSHTQTYLLQHSDQKHRHNRMWDYKPEWGCENIEVINV